MFEKYLEHLIKQKLGAYLDGLDQNQLQFGMTQANLSMDSVKLKKDALLKLNLPITIELGEIKHLEIKVPWLKIGSSPVEVIIEGLYLIISPQKKQQWQTIDIFSPEYLEMTLLAIINKIESELDQQDNTGYFGKLAMKVIDNIQIQIKDIHVRFEDHYSMDSQYTFGFVLSSLQIQTTNEEGNAQYIDRSQQGVNPNLFKMVSIEGFGFYLNPNDNFLIHQQTQHLEKRIQMMEALMSNENDILHYILKPMNLRLNLEQQAKGQKKLNVTINLENIYVSILRNQLKCLIKVFELVSDYHKSQNHLIKTKKFKFLRPAEGKITSRNARQWWKFAYECIRKNNRAKNGSIREFMIPKNTLLSYEQQFLFSLDKFYENKENLNSIQWLEQEQEMFLHILSSVDNEVIKGWVKDYLQPLISKETEANTQSFTSWLLYGSTKKGQSSQDSESELLNEEEIAQLEKEVSTIYHEDYTSNLAISVSLMIKEQTLDIGIVNQENDILGIRVFSKETFASFKSQSQSQELSFDMEASVGDFGVNLFTRIKANENKETTESVLIGNKKIFPQSLDNQWRLRVRKKPDDLRNIEYDFELIGNPLVVIYNKEFIKRAILISKLGVNEETQNAAIDTIEDLREATSNQIYQIIYKKSNRFRINIASPVIILPLTADGNPQSPVWVVRLGDTQIVSKEHLMNTSVIEYERYDILIDSIRMQYFSTLQLWTKNLELMRNFRDKSIVQDKNELVFSVLEDCWMKFTISIKQKKAGLLMLTHEQKLEHQLKPKVIIQGHSSDIKINLTHSLYNKAVNVDKIFDLSQDRDFIKPQEDEMIQTKQQVIKNAKKIGVVQKRLDPLKQWESYFCILQGGYLYFYKDKDQIMPSTYYYLKGAKIEENTKEISLPNNIHLKNRFGECALSLQNEGHFKDWLLKIRDTIYDMQQEEQLQSQTTGLTTFDGTKKKKINHDSIMIKVEFSMPLFSMMIVDEIKKYQEWILLSFKDMRLDNTKKKSETQLLLLIKEISLIDLTMKIKYICELISQRQVVSDYQQSSDSQNALELSILNITNQSPRYQLIDTLIDIKMDNLYLKMQPVSINELIKFMKNTQYNRSFNLLSSEIQGVNNSIQQSEQTGSLVSLEDLVHDQPLTKAKKEYHVNCSVVKESLMHVNVILNNVSISLLHNKYHMDLYRLDSKKVIAVYVQKYDHLLFEAKFSDTMIYDLTGYPYTISPSVYYDNPHIFTQKERELISIKAVDQEFGLTFAFETYSSKKCVLKREGISSSLKLSIKPLIIDYFQESFMRFYQYFFEQFLNSIIYTDPYSDPLKEEFDNIKRRKTIKRDTIKHISDFKQVTDIMDMNIKIEDLQLNIPDRPFSKSYLSFQMSELTVIQSLQQKAKRILQKADQKLFVKCFKINCNKTFIKFGPDYKLTQDPFNLRITFETLAYSSVLAKVDPHAIEQAPHLRLEFDPINLTMPQDIYTQILRCLDLNVNYQDKLSSEYFFVRYVDIDDFYKQLSNVVSMRIKIHIKSLSISLKHLDGSHLSELLLTNMGINMIKHMDYNNKMLIKVENFYIIDTEQKHFSQFTIAHFLKLVNNEDFVIQPLSQKTEDHDLFKVIEQEERKTKAIQNQLLVEMITHASGDKEIKVDISGLRITIKPHVLLMIYYFFLNAFPEYDEHSIDKPSYYNFDPEEAPSMDLSISLQDSLLLLQNKPGLKTIALQGRIFFELKKTNIKSKKKYIQDQMSFAEELKEDEDQKQFEDIFAQTDSKVIWQMALLIEDLCPFVCSFSQLKQLENFAQIKKRQLFTPFNLNYSNTYELICQNNKNYNEAVNDVWGVNASQELKLQRLKMKISLQDMHLFFQIITFANENVTNEYMKKLEKIEEYIKKQKEKSLMNDDSMGNFDRSKTIRKDFGISKNKVTIDKTLMNQPNDSEDQDQFVSILDNIQQQYEQTIASQMQRLRTTTQAFSAIAHKYTTVANKQSKFKQSVTSRYRSNDKGQLSAQVMDSRQEEFKSLGSSPDVYQSASPKNNTFGSARQLKVNFQLNKEGQKESGTHQLTTEEPIIEEDQFEMFHDARSEMFYSLYEKGGNQQNNQSKYVTPTNIDNKSKDINEMIFREVNDSPQKKEKVKYLNAMENVFHSSKIYKTNGISIVKIQLSQLIYQLFINDYDNVFCPVLDIDIPEISVKSEETQQTLITQFAIQKLKIHYFNTYLGDWEPFLENLYMDYIMQQSGKQQLINIEFKRPICFNLTENCITNLIETYNSWMETPPYQYEDYAQRQRLISSRISVSDKLGDGSSNTGSINDDNQPLFEEEKKQLSPPLGNSNGNQKIEVDDIDKVSPYSIKNLTSYPIKVMNSDLFLNCFPENEPGERLSAFHHFEDPRLSAQANYELAPGEEIEYAIDYEKQTSTLLNSNKRRRQALMNQSEIMSQAPHFSGGIDQKKKLKHDELIAILFDEFIPLTNLDLNKLTHEKHLLIPVNEGSDASVDLDEESLKRLTNGSTHKKDKRKSKFMLVKEQEELIYGVVLNRMRKICTIRTPYIINNKTFLDFILRVTTLNQQVAKEYIVKANSQFGLNMKYYRDHNLQFKIKQKKDRQGRKMDEGIPQDGFSDPITVQTLLKLGTNQGRILDHYDGMYTFVKKCDGELEDSIDFVLVPPLLIRNGLPCHMEIMGTAIEAPQDKVLGQQPKETVYTFEKGDEKHFHIFGFSDMSKEEFQFKFRLSGFTGSSISVNRKMLLDNEDSEITIRDIDGNSLNICIRIGTENSCFKLVFYAQTVIINHSFHNLKFHYDSFNQQLLAGQDQRQEYCMANKEDSLLVKLNEKLSKSIKIKTAGVQGNFSIIAQQEKAVMEQFGGKNKQKLDNPISHQFQQLQKKFEYVYQTYLSLVIENEEIYTKIVQIAPKYVIFNKMRSPLCIAQAGSEYQYSEVLEKGERKEWVWPDANLDEYIVIKKQDVTKEHIYGEDLERSSTWLQQDDDDKFKKWKWSEPLKLNQQELLTIEIKKFQNRFNNLKARKIIKITKKIIDATTYVIFEDEDKKYPLYRLENTTSGVPIWFVQKGQKFDDEGCKLNPKTSIPFAFLNPKKDPILLCLFAINDSSEPLLSQGRTQSELQEKKFEELDFEDIGKQLQMEYTCPDTGETKVLHVSVYTDGCTKTIRFSDKPLQQELKEEKELNLRQSISSTQSNKNNQTQITKTHFQLRLEELLFSFVTQIPVKEKNKIIKARREIAILSIQKISTDYIDSNEGLFVNAEIGSIQIDNQSIDNPVFPTILQPRLFRNQSEQSMITFEMVLVSSNPEITYIDLLQLKFQGMVIKCDDQFVGYAMSFGYEIMERLKTNLTGIHPIFSKQFTSLRQDGRDPTFFQNKNILDLGDQIIDLVGRKDTANFGYLNKGVISVVSKPQQQRKMKPSNSQRQSQNIEEFEIDEIYKSWVIKKLDANQKRLYIKDCQLSQIELEISFLARKGFQLGEKEDSLRLQDTMNWWGLALFNIDEAPIKFKNFSKAQLFGQQEDMSSIIFAHYKEAFKKNILKLIGSTEILGNPRKLMKAFRNGLYDFTFKPFENREQGVGAVVKGTLYGTASLLKNTVEGSFGFFQSVSGQFSKGLLLMTMDKEYLSQREEKLLTEKPKNIVEGVGYGCQTMINSIYSGLTGPLVRPYKECKRSGISGIPVGIYSGMTGLLLKPFSGGLDLISKSTEGVKNTAKIFEAKLFKDRRRLPRVIYGLQESIKSYNDMDSYIVNRILNSIKEGQFKQDHYIETMKYVEERRALFIIHTQENLILLDAAQKSVWWHVNSNIIDKVDQLKNGLIIKLSQKNSDGKRKVAIEINDPAYLEQVAEKLKKLERKNQN